MVSQRDRKTIRDLAANESVWYLDKRIVFERGTAVAAWAGHIIIGDSPTHPLTRDSNFGTVDSTTIDHWISDVPTYCAGINMFEAGCNLVNVNWGYPGSADTLNPIPLSSRNQISDVGGWNFGHGGGHMKNVPLFNFGDTDSLQNAVVDSAKFWLRLDNYNQTADSLFVYSCATHDLLSEWANDNDDVSYERSDESAETAWSVDLTTINDASGRETYGGAEVARVQLTEDWDGTPHPIWGNRTYVFFNVKDLVQEQIDAGRELNFLLTFRTSFNATEAGISDNGHEDAPANERFYLEIWVHE